MAKGGLANAKTGQSGKAPKPVKGPPHIHARIAYLNKIATFIATQQASRPADKHEAKKCDDVAETTEIAKPRSGPLSMSDSGMPFLLGSHLRAVSRKGQIMLSKDVKRAFCKVCNGPLVPGLTSSERLENASKHGKKPWAEVNILNCSTCGADKRYPIGARRQLKKSLRLTQKTEVEQVP